MLDLILSRHAGEKIRLRGLSMELIKQVLNSPEQIYFDVVTRLYVAMGHVAFHGEKIPMVVIYRAERGSHYIATVYPCKEFKEEAERKVKKGRWIKVGRREA
ncbi:hypothetical protein HRbin01_00293 [archaeon HR01]|nr:hypothetical protein HRbin01_00293 [archaeon HR01]